MRRDLGPNRRMERLAWKVVGLTFLASFVLYMIGVLHI